MRIQIAIIFFFTYLICCSSYFRSWSMSNKDFVDSANTPSELTDTLINLTWLYFFFWSAINGRYFSCFRTELVLRFVSKPTVNSRMYKTLFSIAKRRSGRSWSPVITEGLIKPGRSTYSLDLSTLRRLDVMKFKTEFWRHVNLPSSRYDLQPEITCRSDSGQEQKEQSGDDDRPHLTRFFRVGRELLI